MQNCKTCVLLKQNKSLYNTIATLCQGIAGTAPRVLSVSDIIENHVTPTVIWYEPRNAEVLAGVWQIDHYELEDGTILADLGIEIANDPEAYNTRFRVWSDAPNEACKRMYPWNDEKGEYQA